MLDYVYSFPYEVICVEVFFPFSGKFTWQKTTLL